MQETDTNKRVCWKAPDRAILIAELCQLRVINPVSQFMPLLEQAQQKLDENRRRKIYALANVKDLLEEFTAAFFEFVHKQQAPKVAQYRTAL